MKANYMNYFKEGKLYQWDKHQPVFTISNTNIKEEFCLDEQQMKLFLKFNNPEITLGSALNVKSGKAKATIKLTESQLVLPNLEFTNELTVNIDALKLANNFVAKDDVRPILTGVNINNNYIAATDSYSMFKHECKSDCNVTIAGDFIKEISHAKGDITFKVNDKAISCEIDGTTYIGRLLAGTYPDVARLYSTAGDVIKVNKSDFDILNYSTNKSDYLHIQTNKLTLSGENEIEMEIDLNHESIDIWFNVEKIANAIKNINSDILEIRYIDSLRQITINDEIMVLPVKRK